ncbi:phage tail family protein [Peribacillus sp. SCS-26]|uniref:phage tail family protein n=1 Tax=Paraperibacillus marinus TaxID=3115295 RepID=UPI003905F0E1
MIIYKSDGSQIDIKSYGLRFLKVEIPSPSLTYTRETVDGQDGDIVLDSRYENRPIVPELFYRSKDIEDYYLLASELNRLFATKEAFYVVFPREPHKRWLVRLAEAFKLNKINSKRGTLNLEFITESPFAESVGTTLNPLTFESDVWGVGMGIKADDVKYVHSTNTFQIYNPGDIPVDPRKHHLVISFKGASTSLKIKNDTTGEEWSYTPSTVPTDIIGINGIRSLKNGTSIFKDTNKKLITIQPGWNDFTVTGATDFEISFDFRFYYL